MKKLLLFAILLCVSLHAEEKTVNSTVASTEITIKIRGDRKFVEICKVTEIKDKDTGAVLATQRHREAIDYSTVDEKGVARTAEAIQAAKDSVKASVGDAMAIVEAVAAETKTPAK